MRGISFKTYNEYNNYIYKLFMDINLDSFVWDICDSEILYGDDTKEFNNGIISGQEFLNNINKEKYYIVYADIKAFKCKSQIRNIDNYEDFFNSSCEIALFITDSIYCEVYCKNTNILNVMMRNGKSFSFKDINILTKENDSRKYFNIF